MQYRLDLICKGCWKKLGEVNTDTNMDDVELKNTLNRLVLEHRADCYTFAS